MKSTIVGIAIGAVMLASTPVLAQTEEARVNTSVRVKASDNKLFGRVIAPFDTGVPDERPCEAARRIAIFIKTRDGAFKRIAEVTTSSDGKWSAAARREGAVYKIRVAAAPFTYSPQYGDLREGRCLAAKITGIKVTPLQFKIKSSVLGTRITRGGPARLPRTGSETTPFALLGITLIASGALSLRVSRARSAAG